MAKKLINIKRQYYLYLDRKARHIAFLLKRRKKVTKLLLNYIGELYKSSKLSNFVKTDKFETAYHNPISSDLEFLIARILYHLSKMKKLDYKVYLRRQIKNTAPDIRLERAGKTLAVIEVKAKVGWIQSVFSSEQRKKDMKKIKEGKSGMDPRESIKKFSAQIEKYHKVYKINSERVFVLLPSIREAYRINSGLPIKAYIKEFAKNSKLPGRNLLLLSKNPLLNLSENPPQKSFMPTVRFEKFVSLIVNLRK